ncbi:MAG: biotin--[acetyl-CoA-carboxylase] ligase [Halofilum sp. (in: g-proteobacteria)]|nr:biotin--[acetyl-CoA-carboxylase] ligase [Halofilum sp. (in: g-proteobacteria)]
MSEVRRRLLQRLADGGAHPGTAIAAELGVSRAAVAKQVARLRAVGWDIASGPRGYRLSSGQVPLDRRVLERGLAGLRGRIASLELLDQVDSTSSHLARLAPVDDGRVQVCIAEDQSAGRGRRGRAWHARPGGSILLSLAATLPLPPPALAGLSIAAGVVCAETLIAAGVEGITLKWPNDLLVGDAKLGGILVEVSGEAAGPGRVILGIGINHDLGGADGEPEWPITDVVRSSTPGGIDRSALAAALIASATRLLEDFRHHGLAPYLSRWHGLDGLVERPVRVEGPLGAVEGTALGVAADGSLRVRTENGERAFHSGDVSVRRAS